MPPKLIKFPLADLFDTIGMELTCRLMDEVQHMEPLAARFCDEFPRLRKSRRNSAGAARMVQDLNLDVRFFKDMLVSAFTHHQRREAQIRQAAKFGELTDVSTLAAADADNFEERKGHLIRAEVFERDKSGVSIQTNVGVGIQNTMALPSFESDIMSIEDKMRGQLPAAQTEFIDAEVVEQREKEAVVR